MKKYKIGLFGELISEGSINNILENNGFDFAAANSSSAAKPAAKTTADKQTADKAGDVGTGKFNIREADSLVVELTKKAKNVDDILTKIYDGLQSVFKESRYGGTFSTYAGYVDDDELGARTEIFGVDTEGYAHPNETQTKEGFSGNGSWWRPNGYLKYLEVEKIIKHMEQMINSFCKNNKINKDDLYEEYPNVKNLLDQLPINKSQVYTVFKKVVDAMNRSYGYNNVKFSYMHLVKIIDPDNKDLLVSSTSYNVKTDF